MKLNQYQADKVVEIIAMLVINLAVFLLSKIFIEINLGKCVLYSFLNSLWMPFILLPIVKNIQAKFEKNEKSYVFEPSKKYIDEFEKRQQAVQREIQFEAKEIEELEKTYRKDWKLFRKHLQRKGIKNLYHFTDEANLKSIIQNGGLFSWHYCMVNNLRIERPGGGGLSRQLDKRAGLENFVRLSFTPDHPMMYAAINDGRIQSPVVLEINIDVIFLKDTKFSDKNATRTGVNIGQTFNDFSKIRFDILSSSDYLNTTDDNKPYFQAEVLVKEKILIGHIKNIQRINTAYT